MVANENPGAQGGATGAGVHFQGNGKCTNNLTQNGKKIQYRERSSYRVTTCEGERFTIHLSGRLKWALDMLTAAGPIGCAPIDQPAPRWSAYVHSLREMGIKIETLWEGHGGKYPGRHGRYVLRSKVWMGGIV